MKTRIWLNLDPTKVDVSHLYHRFEDMGCEFTAEAVEKGDREGMLAHAMNSEVIIATMEPYDEEIFSRIEGRVRFIQKYGTGLDTIDLAAASRHGIPVANVPGANAAAVAETALLHILNLGRKFVPCVTGVKKGIWPSTITGSELDGKTVGLLGYGKVARHLARMLSGFDVRILAYDPFVEKDPEGRVELVESREELFRGSDIVSLHIPCTAETAGTINRDLFCLMKKGSFLVNTCRGGVVNERDLVQALRDGTIAAAGLDVLVDEPPKEDNELMKMDNVFISSHMGAASLESELRSQIFIADNIEKFLKDGKPDSIRT